MNNSEISRSCARFRKPGTKTDRKLFISLAKDGQKYAFTCGQLEIAKKQFNSWNNLTTFKDEKKVPIKYFVLIINSEISGEKALPSENQQLKLLEHMPSLQQPCQPRPQSNNACDKSQNFSLCPFMLEGGYHVWSKLH